MRVAARAPVTVTMLVCSAAVAWAQVPAYLDTNRSFLERAVDLVSRMTLEEKASQLGTSNALGIPRLGVQEYAYWSEAQHGISMFWGGNWFGVAESMPTPVPATSFPTNFAASMSWDAGLVRRETDAISDEARGFLDPALFDNAPNNLGPLPGAYGSLFYFNPTINIGRDPRWGRNDETFGEDPFLTGVLGSAYVHGFQGQDEHGQLLEKYLKAVATAKHFALNNVEHLRTAISSNTDESTIRDYYTSHFRRVVENGDVSGLMSSYNAVNGVPAVANALLLNVLARRTFGFDGYITSDCAAVATTYRRPDQGIGAPGTSVFFAGHDWAPPGWRSDHGGEQATWTRVADGTTISGKAGGEAFSLRTGTDLNCTGDDGDPNAGPPLWLGAQLTGGENAIHYIREAIDSGALSEDVIDRALVRVFTLRMKTGEFDPRGDQPYTRVDKSVIQSPEHRDLAEEVAKRSLVLLRNEIPAGTSGRRRRPPLLPADPNTLSHVVILGDQANKTFLGGYSGAPAERITLRQGLTDAIKAANPSATITYDAAGSSAVATVPAQLSPEAQQAVREADLIVVMVGTDGTTSSEGSDRRNVAMPGNYGSLVGQTAALGNPRIALVIQAGSMVELGAVGDEVAAILFSGPAGQRQGRAFAAALLGAVNPSGRLNFTWYRDSSQLPGMDNYDLAPSMTGGIGRTYQYFTGTPDYPFGFGLSYTRFRWSRLDVTPRRADANDTTQVSLTVTNVGKRPGADVVEVYAKTPRVAGREVPIRRLVGFSKTRVLAPGEKQDITIDVSLADTLRLWDDGAKRARVHPGRWTFEVSRWAGDRKRRRRVRISGDISLAIRHLTAQPPTSTLKVGDTLDLRGKNPWLQGLAPTGTDPHAEDILTAVREDDSFADLTAADVQFDSTDPGVVDVTGAGVLVAQGAGVATVTASLEGKTVDMAFVVR